MKRHLRDAIVPLLLVSLAEKEEPAVWSKVERTHAPSAWIQARSASLRMMTKGESEQLPFYVETF